MHKSNIGKSLALQGRNLSRRAFLGACAATPFYIKAANKSGSRPLIVGEGEFQYEWISDWGELPANIKYGNCHALAEDSHGNIYVLHTVHPTSESGDSVVVFDPQGRFVRSWGWQFRGGAHGLRLHREGRTEYLYVSDTQHRVVTKRTLKGEEVWTIGYPSEAKPYAPNPGIPYRPTNVAIAANGDFYVADGYGSSFINRYDKATHYHSTFGGKNAAEPGKLGSLDTPHDTLVDTRGASPLLLVADRSNGRLQRFTLEGDAVSVVGGFSRPCFLNERNGMLVVADLASRVTLLDSSDKIVAHLADGHYTDAERRKLRVSQGRGVFEAGKFIAPHSAIFDHAGNIFVAEYIEIGRVTKLRKV